MARTVRIVRIGPQNDGGTFGVVVVASQYYLRRPTGHLGEHYGILLSHIIAGSVTLLVGPWQFSRRLRRRSQSLHRWMGRIYLLAVAFGSLAGFALALFSAGGVVTHFGFGILAVLWFFTGWMAYHYARAGRIEQHREWMVRKFFALASGGNLTTLFAIHAFCDALAVFTRLRSDFVVVLGAQLNCCRMDNSAALDSRGYVVNLA
jgi:uncharacterized membrane protein